jgi:hypothetical protein
MPIKLHAQHASPPASPEQIRDDVSRLAAVEQRSLDQFNRICRRVNAIRGGLFSSHSVDCVLSPWYVADSLIGPKRLCKETGR